MQSERYYLSKQTFVQSEDNDSALTLLLEVNCNHNEKKTHVLYSLASNV